MNAKMARSGSRSRKDERCIELAGSRKVRTFRDGGFTLVELLVSMTILPLVMGAISMGLISVFSLNASTSSRISNSADAQMVAAYFQQDVQGSELITTELSSSPQCGTGNQLLGIQWNGGNNAVSYVSVPVVSGPSTTYTLVRNYCAAGDLTTPVSTKTLANSLSATQSPPTITCPSTATSCSPSTGWVNAAFVSDVTFSITEPSSNYSYSLSATPRAWTAASGGTSGGGTPYAPLTLLDPTSCNALRVGQGNLTIDVGGGNGNGVLNVASDCPGTVTVSNGGTLAASSLLTADPGLAAITPNAQATYPSTEYYTNQFSDPFASLTPPATPSGPSASCTSSVTTNPTTGTQTTTYTCPSGVYSSPPSFTGTDSVIVNFTGPGSYYFPEGLVIPNNVTVNFASGAYIFDGTTAFSTGNNVTLNGSNVLFYIGSGTVTIGNNNSLNLTALAGYDGITFWDAVNGGTVTIGNNTNIGITASLGGGLYMPKGNLTTGENVTISTTFVIADTAYFGNNLDLTISSP